MDERTDALRWLIAQVQSIPDDQANLEFDLLHPEEVRARVSQAMAEGFEFSSDLAWVLAEWAAREGDAQPIEELSHLNECQQINLMRLAVELADISGLEDSVWLALAANWLYLRSARGLAQDCAADLVERLSNCGANAPTLLNIADTLSLLDSLIGSLDNWRREIAVLVATGLVLNLVAIGVWTDIPALSQPYWSTVSNLKFMIDWVIEHSNQVIRSETTSERSKWIAFVNSYKVVSLEAEHRVTDWQADESSFWAWVDQRVSSVAQPNLTDPVDKERASQHYAEVAAGLHLAYAEILLSNHRPNAASGILLEYQTLKGHCENPLHSEGLHGLQDTLVKATEISALGDSRQALRELENGRSLVDDPYGSAAFNWAVGRLRCETGNVDGLCDLRDAVERAGPFMFRGTLARMVLLLAEKEVEIGDAERALCLLQDLDYPDMWWFLPHARVILAEVHMALARNRAKPDAEHIDIAEKILIELSPDTISHTPDRIRPRAFAALGEIALIKRDAEQAQGYLRRAMAELEGMKEPYWDNPESLPARKHTPDNGSHGYWRRPWNRNWAYAAELSLIAELSDRPNQEHAFAQLQRYRKICHAGTVAELAGFVPEASLTSDEREKVDGLRGKLGQVQTQGVGLRDELQQIDKVLIAVPEHSQAQHLLQRRESLKKAASKKVEDYLNLTECIEVVEKDVVARRGYLAHTGVPATPPPLSGIKERLATADAAVIELVRVNGARWGLGTSWFAFVVTPESKGVDLIPLTEPSIDSDLRTLRNDRFALNKPALAKLSEAILGNIPNRVFKRRKIFIAADGDAWTIPFRSLLRPRWRIIPWSLALALPCLACRMDQKMVSNVISTNHLHRLLIRPRKEPESLGIVVGSSGGSEDRALCEGLAKSLEVQQPASDAQIRWKRYSGSLIEATPPDSDRPEWLDGTSGVFMASWHTTFTGDSTTIAKFHFGDGEMTLARFLSQSRHRARVAVILSCSVSMPEESGDRVFSRIGSAAFGIAEALQVDALVATTNEVTAEIAFVLGHFLSAELADGRDVHTALARAQRRLRRCNVADVKRMLEDLQDDVPGVKRWLEKISGQDGNSKAFPRAGETEPFYILGLPTAWWNTGASEVTRW